MLRLAAAWRINFQRIFMDRLWLMGGLLRGGRGLGSNRVRIVQLFYGFELLRQVIMSCVNRRC